MASSTTGLEIEWAPAPGPIARPFAFDDDDRLGTEIDNSLPGRLMEREELQKVFDQKCAGGQDDLLVLAAKPREARVPQRTAPSALSSAR